MQVKKVNDYLFKSISIDKLRNRINQSEKRNILFANFANYDDLIYIPSNTIFSRSTYISLNNVIKIGDNVIFKNTGDVFLHNLKELPPSTKFQNKGYLDLKSLTTIPDNFSFESKIDYNEPTIIFLSSVKDLPSSISFIPNTRVMLKNTIKYF